MPATVRLCPQWQVASARYETGMPATDKKGRKFNEMDERKGNIISLIGMFILGGLIGAGVALLMAPQSGMDMRMGIRDKSLELKDRAVSKVDDTRQQVGKTLDDVTTTAREKVQSLKDRGQEVIEEGKSRI